MAGSIDKLFDSLAGEFGLRENLKASGNVEKLEDVLIDQKGLFSDFGKSGDLDQILVAEKLILAFERNHYANSKSMATSLDEALADLAITQKLVKTVTDADAYCSVNTHYARSKSRIGDLPRDEARQFFRSHATRLLNSDKVRLSLVEKKIIDARRANMRTAEKQYIALQQIALGITPQPPDKARRAGLGI